VLEASVHALFASIKILGQHFATTLLKHCKNISAVFQQKAICKISCQSSKVHQAKSLQVPLVYDSVSIGYLLQLEV